MKIGTAQFCKMPIISASPTQTRGKKVIRAQMKGLFVLATNLNSTHRLQESLTLFAELVTHFDLSLHPQRLWKQSAKKLTPFLLEMKALQAIYIFFPVFLGLSKNSETIFISSSIIPSTSSFRVELFLFHLWLPTFLFSVLD